MEREISVLKKLCCCVGGGGGGGKGDKLVLWTEMIKKVGHCIEFLKLLIRNSTTANQHNHL